MEKVQTNCPNCGAVMHEDKCDHCGTIIYDFACLDAEHPCYIKIKKNNKVYRLKVQLNELRYDNGMDDSTYYGDDTKYLLMRSAICASVDIHFTVLPWNDNLGNKDINMMLIDTDVIDKDCRPY